MNRHFLQVFVAISALLLSSTTLPIYALPPQTISFTGKIAVSRVEPLIDWRIVVEGVIKMPGGGAYIGTYTVFKLTSGEIVGPVEPDVFQWSFNGCHLEVLHVPLIVDWTTEPPTETLNLKTQWNGDTIKLNGRGREAVVEGNWGYTGTGFVVFGSGKITLG